MTITAGGENGVRITVFNDDTAAIPAGFVVSPKTATAPRESTMGEEFVAPVTSYDDSLGMGVTQERIDVGEFGIVVTHGTVMVRTTGSVAAGDEISAVGAGSGIVETQLDGTVIGVALQTDLVESIESDFGTNTDTVALCIVQFPATLIVASNT